jgi:electron transfer flavoprotein alpha subunit
MSKVKKVWVFAEKQSVLAQLCAGGRQLGDEVAAIVLGSREEAEKGIYFGADQVFWVERNESYSMLEDYFTTVEHLVKNEAPNILMLEGSKRTKLMAGRLAARLETSVLVDAAEIRIEDGTVLVSHMVYGGAAFRMESTLADITITTVGTGVYSAVPEDATRQGNIVQVDFIKPPATVKLLEKKQKTSAEVNLNAAKRVVGVGRGIANQEDLTMLEEFTALIKAELGCSRPLAEGVNWLPRERYIGVSGAIIKPEVYFAIGISGQVQHMVGVNQAKVIIAINKDKTAPIFQQCDYGVIGDLYKILPALQERIKSSN